MAQSGDRTGPDPRRRMRACGPLARWRVARAVGLPAITDNTCRCSVWLNLPVAYFASSEQHKITSEHLGASGTAGLHDSGLVGDDDGLRDLPAHDDQSSVTGCLRACPLDACPGEQVSDDDGADRSE